MGAYGGYSYPSGGGGNKKKKVAIIGISSILLVAMVVALAVGVNRKGGESSGTPAGNNQISASAKAIKSICQPTDYKETCETTLSSAAGNTSDPKELIKVAFNVAVKNIGDAIKNSSFLQEASKDPEIADAIKTCHELLNLSIADLKKSFEKVGDFNINKLDDYVADLKTWLSGAITYQQTCLDGFDNTTGDAGQKMKKLLKTSGELTSNGLAMVTEISTLISSLQIPGLNRRLLNSEEQAEVAADGFPSWVSDSRRRLLQATPKNIRPNVVVAKDGSGKYRTINQALKDIPKKGNKPFVIYIKAGVYAEYLDFTSHMTNVMLLGDGPTKTKITGSRSKVGGYNTYRTATVAASGDHFMAKNIGFENTAGSAKHQAVALRVSADMSIIYNCQIDGYQDTLYAHTHRQFYRDCTISGTVDFVFGDAASVFQNCKLVVRMPLPNQMCMVTAQGRHDRRATTGIVLQNCTITADPKLASAKPAIRSFLGRPWKNYSRTIIMNSQIDKVIDPEGWFPWAGTVHLDTLWYVEFNNRGPGSVQNKRVKWRGIKKVNAQQVAAFTPGKFLRGDTWIPVTGVPYKSGM